MLLMKLVLQGTFFIESLGQIYLRFQRDSLLYLAREGITERTLKLVRLAHFKKNRYQSSRKCKPHGTREVNPPVLCKAQVRRLARSTHIPRKCCMEPSLKWSSKESYSWNIRRRRNVIY